MVLSVSVIKGQWGLLGGVALGETGGRRLGLELGVLSSGSVHLLEQGMFRGVWGVVFQVQLVDLVGSIVTLQSGVFLVPGFLL
jgi:hypothetical protein